MPKPIIKYQCEFCYKKTYASKHRTREHEKNCFYNPENKSCATCNFQSEGENGEGWCDELLKAIFVMGQPIRDCPNWEKAEWPDLEDDI